MNIAIIGFARFGQLWAELLKPFGGITVFNRKMEPEKVERAMDMKLRLLSLDELDELRSADLIFISVSISGVREVIRMIKPFIKPGAVVMDVCSVKVLPCQWLENYLPLPVETLGCHPLFGPDSIKTGLKGKQVVLCPLNIRDENLRAVKGIFEKLELDIIETTPDDHDRQTAYSLAMVHFVGRGLGKIEKYYLRDIYVKTLGFDRLLQLQENVRNDSWRLFLDMQKFNPYSKEMRKMVLQAMTEVEKEIELDADY